MRDKARSSAVEGEYLDKAARRTNECWMSGGNNSIYVYGHRFLAHLEGSALVIWMLMDGTRSIAEIVDALCVQYPGAERRAVLNDTVECVNSLERLGLAAWHARPLFEDVRL